MVGIWLLLAEHLRLGTWDLLKAWSGAGDEQVQTRLAMQLVNERALCVKGIRQKRTLSQKGFELANGLPFIATDCRQPNGMRNIYPKVSSGHWKAIFASNVTLS